MIIQHAIPDAQFIDNIAVLTGFATQFLSNICHINLQLFDTAIIHRAPNRPNDRRIDHDLSTVLAKERKNIEFRLGHMNHGIAY